ncbi:Uncharacterised protein [uncultured archaeon]|nr:Uncharacterised protein [uncultured archaeon]
MCPEEKKETHLRGQTSSIDLVLAVIVFMFILVFVFSFMADKIAGAAQMERKNRLEYAALSASDLLINGPGVPSNWEQNISTLQTIGLARYPYELGANKLANFTSMNYTQTKSLLGIDADYSLSIISPSSAVLYSIGSVPAHTNNSIRIERYALLDGQTVRLRLIAYD